MLYPEIGPRPALLKTVLRKSSSRSVGGCPRPYPAAISANFTVPGSNPSPGARRALPDAAGAPEDPKPLITTHLRRG